MSDRRSFTVLTHRRTAETAEALKKLSAIALESSIDLRFDEDETRKHGLKAGESIVLDAPMSDDVDLVLVLGGDGTILRALRRYAGTGVPVFAVNYGEVGFLATLDREDIDDALRRACTADFELMHLPALELELDTPRGPASTAKTELAINDVSFHRKVGERVAELSYVLDGEEVGSVRCDGLVVCTPAGSTGYNLANGGPLLAWGVAGFVVSFIAPHTLTARALVAAPSDEITVLNRSSESLDVSVDGRPVGEMAAGDAARARFVDRAGTLAQVRGSSFYRRLREKFGRLSR